MGILNKNLVYLSGGMDRVTMEEATTWRTDMSRFLLSLDMGVFNPVDKPTASKEDPQLREIINEAKASGNYQMARNLMKPVVNEDLRMLDLSNFVILYVDLDSHMCGSYFEATYATLEKKPVLVVCKQGKENLPNWLFGIIPYDMMFSSFDELKSYITNVDEGLDKNTYSRWVHIDYDKVYGEYE